MVQGTLTLVKDNLLRVEDSGATTPSERGEGQSDAGDGEGGGGGGGREGGGRRGSVRFGSGSSSGSSRRTSVRFGSGDSSGIGEGWEDGGESDDGGVLEARQVFRSRRDSTVAFLGEIGSRVLPKRGTDARARKRGAHACAHRSPLRSPSHPNCIRARLRTMTPGVIR